MNILVVNDDGLDSIGLHLLVKAAAHFANVYVSVPDKESSAMSHGISIKGYLSIEKQPSNINMRECIKVSGTPVDALRAGLRYYDTDFDLVLSGVNHGANLAKDVPYSGTVAQSYEAALEGIPAIAFSADDIQAPYLYDELVKLLDEIIEFETHKKVFMLNVNFPKAGTQKVLGTKITHLGKKMYHTEYVKVRDEDKYHISSSITHFMEDEDSDVYAFENGYVSITPISNDQTDHQAIKKLLKS